VVELNRVQTVLSCTRIPWHRLQKEAAKCRFGCTIKVNDRGKISMRLTVFNLFCLSYINWLFSSVCQKLKKIWCTLVLDFILVLVLVSLYTNHFSFYLVLFLRVILVLVFEIVTKLTLLLLNISRFSVSKTLYTFQLLRKLSADLKIMKVSIMYMQPEQRKYSQRN